MRTTALPSALPLLSRRWAIHDSSSAHTLDAIVPARMRQVPPAQPLRPAMASMISSIMARGSASVGMTMPLWWRGSVTTLVDPSALRRVKPVLMSQAVADARTSAVLISPAGTPQPVASRA